MSTSLYIHYMFLNMKLKEKICKISNFSPYNGNLPIDKGLPTRLRPSGSQTVSHSLRNSFIGSRIFPHVGFYRHIQYNFQIHSFGRIIVCFPGGNSIPGRILKLFFSVFTVSLRRGRIARTKYESLCYCNFIIMF
jgi:hypothetical protein